MQDAHVLGPLSFGDVKHSRAERRNMWVGGIAGENGRIAIWSNTGFVVLFRESEAMRMATVRGFIPAWVSAKIVSGDYKSSDYESFDMKPYLPYSKEAYEKCLSVLR